MKSLHLVYSFPPDPPGGTEIYVDGLCRSLLARGDEALVVAPDRADRAYSLNGLCVRRFEIDPDAIDVDALYGRGEASAAEAILRIVDRERPDVVHQHALTSACSVEASSRIKRAGYPLVFTYHTPTVTCQRGTMLEMGRGPCDGRLDAARCTACTLQGLGLAELPSQLLGHVPASVGQAVGSAGLSGGGWTALRMRALMTRRIEAFADLVALVDRFVVLTPWVGGVLRANDVPEAKLVASVHGVPADEGHHANPPRRTGILRVAHLGRLDPTKGARLLAEAVQALPKAPMALDIFGVVQSGRDAETRRALADLTRDDARIRLLPPVEHAEVVRTLSAYDLVAVPSQWMETGPLVILEAFAAGVPVIGSALGGIADKVRDGVDGLLVRPPGSVDAWRAALSRCADDQAFVSELRQRVAPVRSMADVAEQMAALYLQVCSDARTTPGRGSWTPVRSTSPHVTSSEEGRGGHQPIDG